MTLYTGKNGIETQFSAEINFLKLIYRGKKYQTFKVEYTEHKTCRAIEEKDCVFLPEYNFKYND